MAEKKSVMVTGASTGIGYAIAKVLGSKGMHVFGGVRKQADADRLQRELGAAFNPLLMDVSDEPAVQAAAAQVSERLGQRTLFGLVKNSGVAGVVLLLYQPIDEFRRTF